ncbi:tyrosine-type recombinase/integrase [Nitrospinota bacterium]
MTILHPYEDPRRRCLKVQEWPERDRRAWMKALEPGDILDGTAGPGFHWSEQTREKYRKGYGRWLTFLTVTGRFEPDVSPADRITAENVRAYIEELRETVSSWTLWGRLSELLAAAKVLAPDRDWGWLRQVVRHFEGRVQSSKDKLLRLRSAAEIANWAFGRMVALTSGDTDRRTPVHYRDALMVALLIHCPTMRLANLAMIRIGKHLCQLSEGYQLLFAPEETKTRKPFAIPVPASLVPYIDCYLRDHRPTLLGSNDTDRLWINYAGRPLSQKGAYDRIVTVTEQAFGVPINPHLFRDCAVTSVALENPEHIGIAAPILGHTDPRTTEEHYIQANAIVAGRKLRRSVDILKEQFPPPI